MLLFALGLALAVQLFAQSTTIPNECMVATTTPEAVIPDGLMLRRADSLSAGSLPLRARVGDARVETIRSIHDCEPRDLQEARCFCVISDWPSSPC